MNRLFAFLVAVLFASIGVSQGRDSVSVASLVNSFNSRYPREKVFLHFDNTAYYLNEIIWFKAYLLTTNNDSLGSLSRVLYVELLDPSGEILETKKCLVEDGVTHGEFLLSRYTQSGFYQVRAYTRYMLNWGSECVFSRTLPVFKRPSQKGDYSDRTITEITQRDAAAEQSASSRYAVSFFPEGGNLVKGLTSRVAFEVTDGNGRQVNACGWLEYGNGQRTEIKILREGRGVFGYTPSADAARMVLNLPNGKQKYFSLPDALDEGCVMTVDDTRPDAVSWTVVKSKVMRGLETEALLVHNGKAQEVKSPLDRKDMPDGCSQLCLVDKNGALLASRMVFNYPRHGMGDIFVTAADSSIWPDKDMTLGLNTSLRGSKASVSVSVCDAETQLAADTHNTATWLLLSSDLKGYIREPEYYLEADDSIHRSAASLLMMVQGWRKYDIESMDGLKEWKKKYPVERGLLIDGRLKAYNKRSKIYGANLEITMLSQLGSVLKGDVTTDSTGYYVFTVPDCWRQWTMIMHTTRNDLDKRYYITVNRHFTPEVEQANFYARNDDAAIAPTLTFQLDSAYIDSIPQYLRNHWLDEVEVKAKRIWKSPKEFWERESMGAKNASIRYDMIRAADKLADQGEEAPTLIEWLKEKNPLFDGFDNITGEYANGYVAFDNVHGDGPTYGGKGIMWIVDNHFVCGTSIVRAKAKNPAQGDLWSAENIHIPFDINEVRSVYVSTATDDWKRFLMAPQLEGQHYVTIFVYMLPESQSKMPKGYRRTTFTAYSFPEDYRQMMSLTGADLDGADYRRTLYWNPDVRLDSDGNATISFKNNSTSRHMTVSAMGFTQDGKPLRMK